MIPVGAAGTARAHDGHRGRSQSGSRRRDHAAVLDAHSAVELTGSRTTLAGDHDRSAGRCNQRTGAINTDSVAPRDAIAACSLDCDRRRARRLHNARNQQVDSHKIAAGRPVVDPRDADVAVRRTDRSVAGDVDAVVRPGSHDCDRRRVANRSR